MRRWSAITVRGQAATILLALPLFAVGILLVLQSHTNDRLTQSIHTNSVNLNRGCVRAVESRERLLDVFDGLHERGSIEAALLAWIQNATAGISEYPNSNDPHRVNLVDCDKFYPVP